MTPTRRPPAPAPSGHTEMTIEEAALVNAASALVNAASGVDTAVIEALEQVLADLRAAQAARAELAARVPTELLRQILLARSEERA